MRGYRSVLLTIAGLVSSHATETLAADLCDFVAKQVPAALGSAPGKAQRSGNEICAVQAADQKSILMGRVTPSKMAGQIVALSRKSAQDGDRGTVSDEPSLGAGAWSRRNRWVVEFSFVSGGNYMMAVLTRDSSLAATISDADVAKAREFAKALSKQ